MLLKHWGDRVRLPPRPFIRLDLDFNHPGDYYSVGIKLGRYFDKCTVNPSTGYDPSYDPQEFLKAVELIAKLCKR